MFQYFNDISVLPRSNYETEDIYKIKGQILEITRKPRPGKAFQNFTGYQICHRKVSFQCLKISNSIHAISAANPTQILHNIYEGEKRDENTKRNSVNAMDR